MNARTISRRSGAATQAGAISLATVRMWKNAIVRQWRTDPAVLIGTGVVVGAGLLLMNLVSTALIWELFGGSQVREAFAQDEHTAITLTLAAALGLVALAAALEVVVSFLSIRQSPLHTVIRLRRVRPITQVLSEAIPAFGFGSAGAMFLAGLLLVAVDATVITAFGVTGILLSVANLMMTITGIVWATSVVIALRHLASWLASRAHIDAGPRQALVAVLPALWLVAGLTLNLIHVDRWWGSSALMPTGMLVAGAHSPGSAALMSFCASIGNLVLASVLATIAASMCKGTGHTVTHRSSQLILPNMGDGATAREFLMALRDPSYITTAWAIAAIAVIANISRLIGLVDARFISGVATQLAMGFAAFTAGEALSRTKPWLWVYKVHQQGVGSWLWPKVRGSFLASALLIMAARLFVFIGFQPASDELMTWAVTGILLVAATIGGFVAPGDNSLPMSTLPSTLVAATLTMTVIAGLDHFNLFDPMGTGAFLALSIIPAVMVVSATARRQAAID